MRRFSLRPWYWRRPVIKWRNFCRPGYFLLSFVLHPRSSTQGWIYPFVVILVFWLGPLRVWAFTLNQGKWKHVSICTSCCFFLLPGCEKVNMLNIVLGANNKHCLTLMQTCVATSLVWGVSADSVGFWMWHFCCSYHYVDVKQGFKNLQQTFLTFEVKHQAKVSLSCFVFSCSCAVNLKTWLSKCREVQGIFRMSAVFRPQSVSHNMGFQISLFHHSTWTPRKSQLV